MDKTRVGIGVVIAVLVVQTLVSLVWSADATLTGIGLAFNAVAAVSTALFIRRGGKAAWAVTGWFAGFFGWHVVGLGSLAGWWTADLAVVFAIAANLQLSVLYQAVMTAATGVAVHLILPRVHR